MDRQWIVNELFCHLPAYKRRVVTEGLLNGPPLPTARYEDMGITPVHLPHPNDGATRIWQDAANAAAFVKNLTKLFDLGALARPIRLDENGRGTIDGGQIFMVNCFGVPKDGKTRNVSDFGQTPIPGKFHKNSPSARFCYNSGWSDVIATMGFNNLADYSSLLLAMGVKIDFVNSDFSGWFNTLYSQKELVRYHCLPLKVPGPGENTITTNTRLWAIPVMTTCQGSKIAAVHCAMISHALMHSIACKMAKEFGRNLLYISYEDMIKPQEYGLATLPYSYEEMRSLPQFRPRISNPNRWIESANDIICRWRTMKPGEYMPCFIVHQDDILVARPGENSREEAYQTLLYMHKQFKRANIPCSTECSKDNVSDEKIFCGRQLLPGMQITLSDERWEKYTMKISALAKLHQSMPIKFLLSLAGNISYTMDLFPQIRPLLAPFTWWLSQMNAICKDNKRLWKIWKEKYVAVPKILVDLIFEGWRRIYRKRADAINFVKIGFDAKTKITVDWSTKGGGSQNLTTNQYFTVVWPKGHELTKNKSSKGEFFMLHLAYVVWHVPGQDIEADEDNKGCISIVEKYRAKPSFGDISMLHGIHTWESGVRVFPKYTSTDDITADPLSRTCDKNWYEEYQERCRRKGVPVGNRVHVEWEPVWEDVLRIRERYPRPLVQTHLTIRLPF